MARGDCDPVVECRDELIAAAAAIVGCRAVAEDLVQESWIRFRRKGYDRRTAASLLRRIVRNLAIDWFRRTRLERECHADIGFSAETTPDAERIQITREELRSAASALAELPARTRQAFVLRRVEGLSFAEIGARLGISNQRAHQLVRAALVHLDRRMSLPAD